MTRPAGPGVGTVRVMVVDDHPVVGDGVRLLTRSHPEIAMVGYAPTGRAAVEAVASVAPDVVLLDLRLPDMQPVQAVRGLRAVRPDLRIVGFTAYTDHSSLTGLRTVGIDGCLLKDILPADFADAIRRAARGEKVFDPRLSATVRQDTNVSAVVLTPREHEVLRRAAMGETNPEIAIATGLARNTVKAYMQTVLQKLGARNRVEAMVRATEWGLL